YCLPLYDPLRLIEEVCMLDQLSRGRFDFGVGRGIVPYEMAYFNLHHLETEEIYREALEVILQGLTTDVLDHRGPRYTYRNVPMVLRPFQQPHPPLWYGLGHTAGVEWAATNKVNVITNHTCDAATPLFERYRDVWQRKHGGAPMPKLGMSRHVVVAPTDAQAEGLARPNYAIWYANLTKLWRDFGSIPIRFARDFDEARPRGIAIAGTPGRVREVVERLSAPVPRPDRAPETLALGLDGGQEGRLVHASGLAAVDQHLAVDDDRLDVATRAALDERLDGVVDGAVMRLEQVDDDDV